MQYLNLLSPIKELYILTSQINYICYKKKIALCKPIETYVYARKKHPFASDPAAEHPFASAPAAKHPNTAHMGLQTYDKKPANLISLRDTGVKFCLRTIVVNSGSFAKVSILVKIYNSLAQFNKNLELLPSQIYNSKLLSNRDKQVYCKMACQGYNI